MCICNTFAYCKSAIRPRKFTHPNIVRRLANDLITTTSVPSHLSASPQFTSHELLARLVVFFLPSSPCGVCFIPRTESESAALHPPGFQSLICLHRRRLESRIRSVDGRRVNARVGACLCLPPAGTGERRNGTGTWRT
jgi:hypothetical protein